MNRIAGTNLDDTLKAIMGSSRPNGDGGVERELPAAHPRWPWLFAERISEVVGQGQSNGPVAMTPLGGVALTPPVFASYDDYDEWQATVEFTARTYPVLPDSLITKRALVYYKDADLAGAPTTFAGNVYPEWWRFTDVEVLPKAEIITCQQGQSAFQRADAALPNKVPFVGLPRLTIPSGALKVTTYFLPYSFVTSLNSYILRYLGRINQASFLNRGAGELLYDSVVITRFCPGYPDLVTTDDCPLPLTPRLLCHVAFIFLTTYRPIGSAATAPAYGSWLAKGHNLMPWSFDRKFYYCTSYSDPATDPTFLQRYPFFQSVPFDILWHDPDSLPTFSM